MTELDLENRHYFMECLDGMHDKCPGEKFKDVYENDRAIGRIRSGKVKKYCECQCHARRAK